MTLRSGLVSLILLALLGCGSHHGGDVRSNADSSVAFAPQGQDSAAYKTLHAPVPFAGIYVNQEYVDKILKNGSPKLAQDVRISCIQVPDSTLKPSMWIYGFHEGVGNKAVVKIGEQYGLYDSNANKVADTIEVLSPDRLSKRGRERSGIRGGWTREGTSGYHLLFCAFCRL